MRPVTLGDHPAWLVWLLSCDDPDGGLFEGTDISLGAAARSPAGGGASRATGEDNAATDGVVSSLAAPAAVRSDINPDDGMGRDRPAPHEGQWCAAE